MLEEGDEGADLKTKIVKWRTPRRGFVKVRRDQMNGKKKEGDGAAVQYGAVREAASLRGRFGIK